MASAVSSRVVSPASLIIPIKYLGSTFDLLFKHVVDAPPVPVETNVDALCEWIVAHNMKVSGSDRACPAFFVQDLRAASEVPKGAASKGSASSLTAVMWLMLGAVFLFSSTAQADESGTPFWLSGSYFFSAAVPAQPGWYIPTDFYYYNGSALKDKPLQRGDTLTLGLNAQLELAYITPTWVPNTKWLGGQPSFSLTLGGGRNLTSAAVSISSQNNTQTLNRSDTLWGGMDLYPIAQIAWSSGYQNWMTYLTGDIPTGAYNSKRLANIGLGHGAIDLGGGYTYFNTKSGFEASAVLGFTYNFENTTTNIQSGVDSHLDWEVAQFLSDHFHVGVVGYVYYQLSGDSGSGNLVGPFKSQIASVGPEVGYVFTALGAQWYANLRGYWEFSAQNRLSGHAMFLTVDIPLQAPKK